MNKSASTPNNSVRPRIAEWFGLRETEASRLSKISQRNVTLIVIAAIMLMILVGGATKGAGILPALGLTIVVLTAEFIRGLLASSKYLHSLATHNSLDATQPTAFELAVRMETTYRGIQMHSDMGILRIEDGQLHFEGEQTAFSMPIPFNAFSQELGGLKLRYPSRRVAIHFKILTFMRPSLHRLLRNAIDGATEIESSDWFLPPAVTLCYPMTPLEKRKRIKLLMILPVVALCWYSNIYWTGFFGMTWLLFIADLQTRNFGQQYLDLCTKHPEALFKRPRRPLLRSKQG